MAVIGLVEMSGEFHEFHFPHVPNILDKRLQWRTVREVVKMTRRRWFWNGGEWGNIYVVRLLYWLSVDSENWKEDQKGTVHLRSEKELVHSIRASGNFGFCLTILSQVRRKKGGWMRKSSTTADQEFVGNKNRNPLSGKCTRENRFPLRLWIPSFVLGPVTNSPFFGSRSDETAHISHNCILTYAFDKDKQSLGAEEEICVKVARTVGELNNMLQTVMLFLIKGHYHLNRNRIRM